MLASTTPIVQQVLFLFQEFCFRTVQGNRNPPNRFMIIIDMDRRRLRFHVHSSGFE
jgi:hypothetical protein